MLFVNERLINPCLFCGHKRLDGEADSRQSSDMKYAKQMSDFVAEHTNIQQADLRRLEDIIAKATKALNAQVFEERGLRERSIAAVFNRLLGPMGSFINQQ